jgi:anti-sigma regulatory factor (Ser/Thr protein kinase)
VEITGPMHELPLDPDAKSVRTARHFLATIAERAEVDPVHILDGQLAVGELVTNAVLHARPPISVRAYPLADALRVDVLDADPTPPALVDPDPSQPGGRGLAIVAAVAAAWGHELHPAGTGKTVWFTLPIRS